MLSWVIELYLIRLSAVSSMFLQDAAQAVVGTFVLSKPALSWRSLCIIYGVSSAIFIYGFSFLEGVEFRFEEIRSVVYKLMRDKDREDRAKRELMIPQKPLKVTVNFRSHSGTSSKKFGLHDWSVFC